MIYTDKSIP